MQQLVMADLGRPAALPQAEHIRLKEPFLAIRGPLVQLQQGYILVLQRLKQPSANHPDPKPEIEAGAKAFEKALRLLEPRLAAKAECSSNKGAASRVRDGIGALWAAFDGYCAEAAQQRPNIVQLRERLDGIFAALSELGTQHELL